MNDHIKLKPRTHLCVTFLLLFFFTSQSIFAQNITIRGSVVDANTGEEVIGASVVQAGTQNGTATDIDGKFTLNVPGNATLVVSYIGYQGQEIPVSNRTSITIQLAEDTEILDEVVVVGYGTQRRSEVTAAVSSLKEDAFSTTPAPASILELAKGKIPGLIIQSGGDPRANANIQIRGTSSLRGDNGPLIVLDGVPTTMENLSLVAPEDVASFDVLKDASAAAIYGTRGSNGVILITTKNGRRLGANDLKPQFEYSGTFMHTYVDNKADVLSAQQYREYAASGQYNANTMIDYGENTDWTDLLTNKNNFSHTHNLSVIGGTRTTNYRASVFYRDMQPISIRSDQQSWGARAAINHLGFNDKLQVTINLSTNNRTRDNAVRWDEWEQVAQRNPTEPTKDENGQWLEDGAYNSYNPLARLETFTDEISRTTTMLSGRATLTIIEGLKASLMGSWDQYDQKRNSYYGLDSKTSKDTYRGGGHARKYYEQDVRQSIEFMLDYSKIINKIHSINVIAGHTYEYNVREGFNAQNSGFLSDAFGTNDLGNGTGISQTGTTYANMESDKWDDKLAAFLGRVNYSLMNKYQLSATIRYEGSSRFGADKRWGIFPAVSGGWIISEEDFMKDVNFVNNLKIRLGYGVTGNLPPNMTADSNGSRYLYMTTFNTSTSVQYPIPGGSWTRAYAPSRNPNPDLKWEEKREWNFGIDYSILKDRIRGTIDIYNRKTVDLLDSYNAQLPPFALSSIWTNVGTISNKGFELGITGTIIKQSDFSWDATATFMHSKNVLESLSNDMYQATYKEYYGLPSPGALGNAIRTEEGKALGGFYGKRFAGFDDDGRWLFYKKDGSIASLSEMVPEDLAYIGNGNPKFQASLTNTFKYKGFDLRILFRGKFKYDILNLKEMYFGNLNWLPNNVLTSAITDNKDLHDAPQYSDYYLEDGTFVKLDELTLRYTFKIKRNNYLRTLSMYASGGNLITFTKYKGTSPDLNDTGLEPGIERRSFYPSSSSLTFGINIGF